MKASTLATLVSAVVLTSSSFAGTADTAKNPVTAPLPPESDAGLFVGVEPGAFWLRDFAAGDPLRVDFKFKTGEGITVPFGYDFGNGLSLSLSAGYDRADFQRLTGELGGLRESASTQGRVTFVPIMANASYSVKLIGNLSWYIGAGAGTVRESTSFHTFDNPAGKSITFGTLGDTAVFDGLTNTDWKFAFQAFTGLSYELSRSASLNLGYRYLNVNDRVSVNGVSGSRLQGQTAELGVVFKF